MSIPGSINGFRRAWQWFNAQAGVFLVSIVGAICFGVAVPILGFDPMSPPKIIQQNAGLAWAYQGVIAVSPKIVAVLFWIGLVTVTRHLGKKVGRRMWPVALTAIGLASFIIFFGWAVLLFFLEHRTQPALALAETPRETPFSNAARDLVRYTSNLALFESLFAMYGQQTAGVLASYRDGNSNGAFIRGKLENALSETVTKIRRLIKFDFDMDVSYGAHPEFDGNQNIPAQGDQDVSDQYAKTEYRKAYDTYDTFSQSLVGLPRMYNEEIDTAKRQLGAENMNSLMRPSR